MKTSEYGVKSIKVSVRLITNHNVVGDMNIVGYSRLSDFMEGDAYEFIKVYNAIFMGIEGHELLINKQHIVFIDMTEVSDERA